LRYEDGADDRDLGTSSSFLRLDGGTELFSARL
jgi:hypothetical protein